MNPSLERIETLAAGTGFQSQALEKVIRLGELAADIGRHPLLGRVLALKGGTALNLLLGAPARLSVDLDFNYVGEADRARMQRERPQVERALEVIGQGRVIGFNARAKRTPEGNCTCPIRAWPAPAIGSKWISTSCIARRSGTCRGGRCGSRRESSVRRSRSCRWRNWLPGNSVPRWTGPCLAICSTPCVCHGCLAESGVRHVCAVSTSRSLRPCRTRCTTTGVPVSIGLPRGTFASNWSRCCRLTSGRRRRH